MYKHPLISYPDDIWCKKKLTVKEREVLTDLVMIEFDKKVHKRKKPNELVKQAKLMVKHKIWIDE